MALNLDRLRTIDDRPPRGQINTFKVAWADFLGTKVISKVGQPGKRPAILRNRLHQPIGCPHPIKGRHQYQWRAHQNRQ